MQVRDLIERLQQMDARQELVIEYRGSPRCKCEVRYLDGPAEFSIDRVEISNSGIEPSKIICFHGHQNCQ